MNPITTIEQLTEALNDTDPSLRPKVMKRIAIPPSAFEEYTSWTNGEYTRNCVARTDEYELILLCWDVDAATPIHGHGGQDCWVYQVQGSVKEYRYAEDTEGNLEVTHESELAAGKLAYMHDRMGYHTLNNESGVRAATLHIYASPIDRAQVFNDAKGEFEMVEMEYDTMPNASLLAG